MESHPPTPATVRELPREDEPGVLHHPGWTERFPWLVHRTTVRRRAGRSFDLALFGGDRSEAVLARWTVLMEGSGLRTLVHARQLHGTAVRVHGEAVPPGLHLAPSCDGHATRRGGVGITVTTADCVPVSLVHEAGRAAGLLHAGWRGVAGGILEVGLGVLGERFRIPAAQVHVHLGPAICGSCYEVGPEVHDALGRPPPEGPEPVDLRTLLAERAAKAGVREDRITVSEHCTRCGEEFFSHRGGDAGRQVTLVGIREARRS